MKKMSRLVALVLTLVMLLSLAPSVFADEPTKITFASYQWSEAGYGDFYRYMAEEFHKRYPQYVIEEVSIPNAQYWDKMIADCAANVPPDIMLYKGERATAMIEANELADMATLMSPEALARLTNDFSPIQNSAPVTVDGKIYGIEMMVATHQLMYNERLLKEANIAVPTTAKEFVDAAIALTKAPNQYGYAFVTTSEDAFTSDVYMWALGFDGNIFKDGFTFNTEKVAEALTYFKKMFDEGVCPIGTAKQAYRTMFAQGQVAFLIDGPWVYTFAESLEENEAENIRTAVVPFETGLSVMSENLLTIPADAKNKEGAMLFLEMCTEYANQAKFTELTCSTAGNANAVPENWEEENPWYSGYVDGAPGATATVSVKYASINNEIRKIITDGVQEILYSDADIVETLNSIQAEIDALAVKNGLK